jgi:hypothetical protein
VASATKAPGLKGDSLSNFSGGPNQRDAWSELGATESVDAWNVSFDERGGVQSRIGYVKDNATPFSGGLIVNEYWSPLLANKLTQAGASLYLGVTNTARKTFTTAGCVTFAEMNALIVCNHPVDGLFTSPDGITWTAVADPDAPKGIGTCIATWQNKLYVGCTDGSVRWSAAGDATNWVATDFNKLWEKDQQGIVAVHIGSGQDILGKPGLVCCKQESSYRINDSTTGSYTTLDATVGAAGPKAIVGVGSKVIVVNKRGIFWWREDQTGMVNASDQLQPLWRSDQINLAQMSLWCAGRINNRAYFSLTRAGSTANDLALEYHPDQGWIAPGSAAMSCYATSTGSQENLYGGSPTVSGQSYLRGGGSDDGAPISWRFQTRWIQPNAGFQAVLWQTRLHGRGAGTFTIRRNFASGGGDSQAFDLTGGGTLLTYDSGLHYDSGLLYSVPAFQQTEPFYNLGVCRQFSFVFEGSSTTTVPGPQVLGQGAAPQVGYFALYSIEWLYVQLGLS